MEIGYRLSHHNNIRQRGKFHQSPVEAFVRLMETYNDQHSFRRGKLLPQPACLRSRQFEWRSKLTDHTAISSLEFGRPVQWRIKSDINMHWSFATADRLDQRIIDQTVTHPFAVLKFKMGAKVATAFDIGSKSVLLPQSLRIILVNPFFRPVC